MTWAFVVLAAAWSAALISAFSRAQQGQREELTASGNCARCHVSSTLEWGISKHSTVTESKDGRLPNCVGCHGVSRNHVVDEQNTFKPDRVAHGEDIAKLCVECHPKGCKNAPDLLNCQNCHHIHALVNPKLDANTIQERAKALDALVEATKGHLTDGQKYVKAEQWEPARIEYAAALASNPGSVEAETGLKMVSRRLKPDIAGFKIVDAQFDPQSGLPREIVMNDTGIDMLLVPAGSFDMGSDTRAGAKPVHTVTLAPFYLAKYEMSQAEWKSLMTTNPSYYQGAKYPQADKFPVEQVSWDDCQAMVAAVNKLIPGGGARLPTEAEWEYAARAGSTDPFDASKALANGWLRDNSQVVERAAATRAAAQDVEALKITASDLYAPHPVGTSKPNAWGLYDMAGNVSQWCSSLAQPYPYDVNDGRESPSAPGLRVLRGPNFADMVEDADPAARHSDRPTRKIRWNGVRLAFTPPEPQGLPPVTTAPTTRP